MTEYFITLLKGQNKEGFLSYLKTLTPEQKKELTPFLKKTIKEYTEYGDIGLGRWGYKKGNDKQRDLLQLAAFVCFSRADYEKSQFPLNILDQEKIIDVIDWYCPSWFDEFVNKLGSADFLPSSFTYDLLITLASKKYLNPGKEITAKLLPSFVFHHPPKGRAEYRPEKLLQYEVTLNEHVWYLFEVETNIHYTDRYLDFGPAPVKESVGWTPAIIQYAKEGRLDRNRLLLESLLASNRNFNKTLSGWFANLFAELKPTNDELLNLQKELFSVLSSPHSKPVNVSLQAIKKIALDDAFNVTGFQDALPVLLSSETKATIVSTLMIIEKLLKKHPGSTDSILKMVCVCFIQTDDDIQARAANVIAKFGKPSETILKEEIATYHSGMRSTARETLLSFLPPEESVANEKDYSPSVPVSNTGAPSTEIEFPQTIDDLVFLASQAFDNNQSWHIDMLPAALVAFRAKIKGTDIQHFEPAFQRAFKMLKNNFVSTMGHLDHLLAVFFIDFGNWLIKSFPSESEGIKKLYRNEDTEKEGQRTSFLVQPTSGFYTRNWHGPNNVQFYDPYKLLLISALTKLESHDDLPMLSTPTHAPAWVSPAILVDRLHLYQQAGKEPDSLDLQISLSRLQLHSPGNAIREAKSKLTGEFLQLMIFMLDQDFVAEKPFKNPAAWIVAALAKKSKSTWKHIEELPYNQKTIHDYSREVVWNSYLETYTFNRYNYQTNKSEKETAVRKILKVYRNNTLTEKTGIKTIFSKLLSLVKTGPPVLYEFLHFKVRYFFSETNDARRILSLVPNTPEPIIVDTISRSLQFPEFSEEGDRKLVLEVAKFLYETWKSPGVAEYLFLGTCLLSADKTILHIAGETWIKGVSENTIDNIELGKVIGKHENIEFAPLKRFTDLVNDMLLHVSPVHDQQLEVLLECVLKELPGNPIKNLKKLLELYREVRAGNSSTGLIPEVKHNLLAWQEAASLKKLIQQITRD